MQTNFRLYPRVLEQLCQWLPDERIRRQRNMALLVMELYLSRAVHLSLVVRNWPSRSKELNLVNRLRRLLNNSRVDVRRWYHPLAQQLVARRVGQRIRLVIDCTKVALNFRLLICS